MDYISFVILHYKDIKVTDTCVQSILAMEQQERIRIVIVDNDIQKSEKDRKELSLKYQENSQRKRWIFLCKQPGLSICKRTFWKWIHYCAE